MATAAQKKQGAAPFVYEGVDRRGNKIKGEIVSNSTIEAKAQLRAQGIAAKKVKKKPKSLFGEGGKKIDAGDIAIFTRQMATMMKAGVPLVQAFEIVSEGLDKPAMQKLVLEIRDEVAAGGAFADSLKKHPKYFDDLFCSLVEAGEQSGALETMLDRVATYKEKTEALKKKIKKALNYPIAVVVVAIVVTGLLLVKVVPQFAETFSSFGAELPAFTQLVMRISDFAIAWWLQTIIAVALIGWAFTQARMKSKNFADKVDAYMLKIPVVGEILEESVIARMSRTLATTFAAGVPLVDALESVQGAAGNAVYRDALKQVKDDVTSGIQLNHALRSQNLFPSMLLQMVAIGEESGALDEMLEKVATFYEESVDNKVDGLTALMEPFIMSVLGILVGGLMIAMYLPIFQIGQVV